MTAPPLPREVDRAFLALPAPIGKRLLQVRALIFATAAAHHDVGKLTETLKWGEPPRVTSNSSGCGQSNSSTREAGQGTVSLSLFPGQELQRLL